MNRCHCGFLAKSPAGLAAHKRQRHPEVGGANRRALERSLSALAFHERITPVDDARVQMLRSMADELDAGDSSAQLWKVYGEALDTILGREDDVDDGLAQALAEIRSAGEVGHSPEV